MRWSDGDKKVCVTRSVELRDAKVKFFGREHRKDDVNGMNCGMNVVFDRVYLRSEKMKK